MTIAREIRQAGRQVARERRYVVERADATEWIWVNRQRLELPGWMFNIVLGCLMCSAVRSSKGQLRRERGLL